MTELTRYKMETMSIPPPMWCDGGDTIRVRPIKDPNGKWLKLEDLKTWLKKESVVYYYKLLSELEDKEAVDAKA